MGNLQQTILCPKSPLILGTLRAISDPMGPVHAHEMLLK